MKKTQEDGWYVFEEKTTKSFARFRTDATRALLQGVPGIVTTYEWRGKTCHISTLGVESDLTFEDGLVRCKVRISWYWMWWARRKVLSDVENTTIDICGAVGPENKTVFIVHGHNIEKRGELQAILGGLGVQSIVLDEADSMGMTVIEKLQYYANTCAFAIVLMTPDDLMPVSKRARQNVVLELGWFMAHLGRERVLLLYTGGLEIPSDLMGIVYVEFKDSVREVKGRIEQALRGCGIIG